MKKIAILRCLHSNDVCTGAACFDAFNHKKAHFAAYQEELELVAFWSCNGCDGLEYAPEGLEEKIERIFSCGIDVLHIGVCTRIKEQGVVKECPVISEIAQRFESRGIKVVRGTH